MIQVGRMIFYDKGTGQVLVTTPSQEGANVYDNPEDLVTMYPDLRDRDRNTFDVIQLDYGQYDRDFEQAINWQVNLETKMLEFIYPDPNNPEEPQPFRKALTEEIEELRQENTLLKAQNTALSERADFIEDVVAEMAMQVYQ